MFRLRALLPRVARLSAQPRPPRFPAHSILAARNVLTRAFSRTPHLRGARAAAPTPTPASTATTAHPNPRTLIYYAGKRTIYLGTLKLYTVLLFSYTSLLVAPQLIQTDHADLLKKLRLPTDLPRWVLPTVFVLGAAVPLVFVSWLSPPYVTHMYVLPPPWARNSPVRLLRYIETMGSGASVELGTIRWFGRPKVARVTLGELRFDRQRWGCVNTVQKKGPGKWYVDWRGSPSKMQVPEGATEALGTRVRTLERERG